MGLVKTRRLAAMHKQERAKAGMKPCLKVDLCGRPKKGKPQVWGAKGK
jgi:hypothetical protein